jgi:hypothetical protein
VPSKLKVNDAAMHHFEKIRLNRTFLCLKPAVLQLSLPIVAVDADLGSTLMIMTP